MQLICQAFSGALHLLGRESSVRDHAQHSPPFSHLTFSFSHTFCGGCLSGLPAPRSAHAQAPHPPRSLGAPAVARRGASAPGARRRARPCKRRDLRCTLASFVGVASRVWQAVRGEATRLGGSLARVSCQGCRREEEASQVEQARVSHRASDTPAQEREAARLRGCAARLRRGPAARRGAAGCPLHCSAPRRAGCPCGPYFCTLCISSLPRPPPRASPPRAGR